MQLIDLSHTVEDGLITYKGLPAPIICDYLSREESRKRYAEGTEFHIGKIEMVANTGTYLDSPFHRFADGADLSELRLEQMAYLDSVLVSASPEPGRAIDVSHFNGLDVAGKAVLVHTGWAATGKPTSILRGIPIWQRKPPNTCATTARRWWALIRSISTTPIPDTVPYIPRCCARIS